MQGFNVHSISLDQDGYYIPRIGELIHNKYRVVNIAGRGVFSSVIKAEIINQNQEDNKLVAIKIIRSKLPMMRESGEKEFQIVQNLNLNDPKDRKNCIRLIEKFEYNFHLCIVYECLEMNLRETLDKYGKNVGLSLDGVCAYGRKLFIALNHLHKNGYIH